MEKEIKAIEEEVFQLVWIMRGGMSLNEGYALSHYQRIMITDLYKRNLETTKDSGLPFF